MATAADWAIAYARQADADFNTFEAIQDLSIPSCHKLQFLQMACEKLVKAHLCQGGMVPSAFKVVMRLCPRISWPYSDNKQW